MQLTAIDAAPPGAVVLSIEDDRYPPLLREIHDPPALLYARGNLDVLRRPQIAIVGSRRASPAGLRLAEQFARQLADVGLSICSGLALGVDGAAHRGALAGGGSSVAVMGTGIESIYPRRHQGLGAELAQAGCLVTEFPPGTPPRPGNFPRRNRIISGLSLGVLVIEAALPSGSLLTAQSAVEQGREVFALPWSVPHAGGRGCLKLLRDGAKMALAVDDILEELGALYSLQLELGDTGAEAEAEAKKEADDPPASILRYIGYEEITLDMLLSCSGGQAGEVMAQLSALEVAGRVVRTPGGYIRSR